MRSVLVFPFAAFLLLFFSSSAEAVKFNCTSTTSTCHAMVGYVPTNATTYAAIKSLFEVKSIRALFGANNLSTSTRANQSVPAGSTVRVPFPCACTNGTGASNHRPVYTVKSGDDLDTIARRIFNEFVTYQEIADANNISNPNLIEVGQKLWIPLPCSCDAVDGNNVVHYGHVVVSGSTVEGIAEEFGTTAATLLQINGIEDPKTLKAGQILDVPLRACSSSISNGSLDSSLLVPNNSYALTASNCVLCTCSSATWLLKCQATQGLKSSVCPSAVCNGTSGSVPLGNSTTISACETTTCAYSGYNNQTILTTLTNQSTCIGEPTAQPPPSGGHVVLQGFRWTMLLLLFNVVMLCSGFH